MITTADVAWWSLAAAAVVAVLVLTSPRVQVWHLRNRWWREQRRRLHR